MSALILGKAHIDALVTAAAYEAPGDCGPLSWLAREPTEKEKAGAYAVGEPWGPDGPRLAEVLRRQACVDQADRVGQMLMRENQLSVNHRYGESEVEDIYTFGGSPLLQIDPVVILKAIDCYEYQSCEHPGWERSEAHAFCRALRRRMISRLPGYDEAPWEIQSREEYARPTPDGEDKPC